MFMPIYPNLVDGIWDKLLQSFVSQKYCIITLDGQKCDVIQCQNLNHEEAEVLLSKLKSRKYVRIGSSRMIPIPVHFSVDIAGHGGRLMDLISSSLDEVHLKKDVSLICQLSFFENKQLETLVIPFAIAGLEDPVLGFEVNNSIEETVVYRK